MHHLPAFFYLFLYALLPSLTSALSLPTSTNVDQYLSEQRIAEFDSLYLDLGPSETEDAIDFKQPKYQDLIYSLANGTYLPPDLRNLTQLPVPSTDQSRAAASGNVVELYPLQCETINSSVFRSDAFYLINVITKFNWKDKRCDQTKPPRIGKMSLGRYGTAHLTIRGTQSAGIMCKDLQPLFESLLSCSSYRERMGGRRRVKYVTIFYDLVIEDIILSVGLHDT